MSLPFKQTTVFNLRTQYLEPTFYNTFKLWLISFMNGINSFKGVHCVTFTSIREALDYNFGKILDSTKCFTENPF